jgi:hypothetical protein
MSKTPHPAKAAGCTKRQIELFELIATGDSLPRGYTTQTFMVLVRNGLIRNDTPPHRAAAYYVPIHVHIQWCQWCSENVTEEELEKFGA